MYVVTWKDEDTSGPVHRAFCVREHAVAFAQGLAACLPRHLVSVVDEDQQQVRF